MVEAPAPLSVGLVWARGFELPHAAQRGAHPRASDSAGLGKTLRICMSSGFPGDADAAGQGTTPGQTAFVYPCEPLWRSLAVYVTEL